MSLDLDLIVERAADVEEWRGVKQGDDEDRDHCAKCADLQRRLDAATALVDGPLTVDAHLRSANGDLFIDATALRRALAGTDTL